jgi:hypothetical protein
VKLASSYALSVQHGEIGDILCNENPAIPLCPTQQVHVGKLPELDCLGDNNDIIPTGSELSRYDRREMLIEQELHAVSVEL